MQGRTGVSAIADSGVGRFLCEISFWLSTCPGAYRGNPQ